MTPCPVSTRPRQELLLILPNFKHHKIVRLFQLKFVREGGRAKPPMPQQPHRGISTKFPWKQFHVQLRHFKPICAKLWPDLILLKMQTMKYFGEKFYLFQIFWVFVRYWTSQDVIVPPLWTWCCTVQKVRHHLLKLACQRVFLRCTFDMITNWLQNWSLSKILCSDIHWTFWKPSFKVCFIGAR